MAITKEELIKLLNADLSKEYMATIQYVQHAAVMTGAQFGEIIKELVIHANEELQHSVTLAEQIDYLKGIPTVDVAPIRVSKDNVEMLKQDLAGEIDAVNRYTERITQAEELKQFALAQKLREILAQEQEHVMDLTSVLGL